MQHARALGQGRIKLKCGLQDPASEVYRKALDMTKKAPELHAELQRQLAASGEVRTCWIPAQTSHQIFYQGLQNTLS